MRLIWSSNFSFFDLIGHIVVFARILRRASSFPSFFVVCALRAEALLRCFMRCTASSVFPFFLMAMAFHRNFQVR